MRQTRWTGEPRQKGPKDTARSAGSMPPPTGHVAPVRARKRLGQCFLHDRHIVEKILDLADLGPGDTVVEIGAGAGVLTAPLAARARLVLAVEIDPRLVQALSTVLNTLENVTVIQRDILRFDLSQAARDLGVQRLKIVGNIPYNISSPILFHLLAHRQAVDKAILMVQKEVAQRLCAAPGNKDYGIPTVFTAIHTSPTLAFAVAPTCFRPVPRVTSAVVRLDFRKQPLAPIADPDLLQAIVRAAFASRRKTLVNNLRQGLPFSVSQGALKSLFETQGLEAQIRGEALSPEQFIALANGLSEIQALRSPHL